MDLYLHLDMKRLAPDDDGRDASAEKSPDASGTDHPRRDTDSDVRGAPESLERCVRAARSTAG